MVAVVWFRKDLRLSDHLALDAAIQTGLPIIPLYILDSEDPRPLGGASKWWLHYSLKSLKQEMKQKGGDLVLKKGSPEKILKEIIKKHTVTHVFWHRQYEPQAVKQDTSIKAYLKEKDVLCQSFNGSLLSEPHAIKNKEGSFFKVFTPYWKHCLQYCAPEKPIAAPKSIHFYNDEKSDSLDELDLLPHGLDWDKGLAKQWEPGEKKGQILLEKFIEDKINGYKINRDFPGIETTSHLSPYLHWGEISVRQIWHAVHHYTLAGHHSNDGWCYLNELGWREFSYYTMFYNSDLAHKPLRTDFNNFPWQENDAYLKAWKKGLTGYPIVDAGMRELWATGYMHNRVRMIVASFLVKHLLQPWQKGEDWFWDTLVDADPASNAFNWQWVAGCGADAAPYFRIFNPILQSEKFDPKGDYLRKWVPELNTLSNQQIHEPWLHSKKTNNYPSPIVDHKKARAKALSSYNFLKNHYE